MTAIALVPLSAYVIVTFLRYAVHGGYEGARAWLHTCPVAVALVLMFLAAGFHHAVSGLQVVIEDYVHCETSKIASLFIIRFLAVTFFILGVLAVLKILFSTGA
jgi:succinate dehydrogenase / fumarate reductase membrane anchor subunit